MYICAIKTERKKVICPVNSILWIGIEFVSLNSRLSPGLCLVICQQANPSLHSICSSFGRPLVIHITSFLLFITHSGFTYNSFVTSFYPTLSRGTWCISINQTWKDTTIFLPTKRCGARNASSRNGWKSRLTNHKALAFISLRSFFQRNSYLFSCTINDLQSRTHLWSD